MVLLLRDLCLCEQRAHGTHVLYYYKTFETKAKSRNKKAKKKYWKTNETNGAERMNRLNGIVCIDIRQREKEKCCRDCRRGRHRRRCFHFLFTLSFRWVMFDNFNNFRCAKTVFLRFALLLWRDVLPSGLLQTRSDFHCISLVSFVSLKLFSSVLCAVFELQKETYDMIYDWQIMLDKWTNDHPGSETKILMTETYSGQPNTMRLYGSNDGRLGAHMPFNFQLIYVPKDASPPHIHTWLGNMPQGHTDNWAVSKRVCFALAVNANGSLSLFSNYSNDPTAMTSDTRQKRRKQTERPTERTNEKRNVLLCPWSFFPNISSLLLFGAVRLAHIIILEWQVGCECI